MIWCEAAGMVRQVSRVAHPYGVEVISGGGQPSLTFCYEQAKRLEMQCYDGWNVSALILQIGDHDPGGILIYQSAGEDIAAFASSIEVQVERLAVTLEQVEEMNLQGQAPKFDPRWKDWTGLAYQAERDQP